MQITLKPKVVYTAYDDQGVPIGEFHQHGAEWNGMIELRDSKGGKIVCGKPETGLFRAAFEDIFGKGKESEGQEVSVVTISPSIGGMLAKRKEAEDGDQE
ncbi:hypothetical protein pD_gene0050 [Vibrio phage 033B]|nr:hypothetical protein pD_gene0050 [Vibrio phage 033B]